MKAFGRTELLDILFQDAIFIKNADISSTSGNKMNGNNIFHVKLSQFLRDALSDLDSITTALSKKDEIVNEVCTEEEVILTIAIFVNTYGETFLLGTVHCLI